MSKEKIDNLIPKLKSCPFCKRKATIVMHPGSNWNGENKILNVGAGHGLWYVGCSYEFFDLLDNNPMCEVKPNASWYASLDEAIRAWNNRK